MSKKLLLVLSVLLMIGLMAACSQPQVEEVKSVEEPAQVVPQL